MMNLASVIFSLALGLSSGAKIGMDDFRNPNLNDNFVTLEETRQGESEATLI